MEKNYVNKAVMKKIVRDIAYIAGEYTKMFPTDPQDLQMVADNHKMYCAALLDLLMEVKDDAKGIGLNPDDMWPELEEKLSRVCGVTSECTLSEMV